MMKVFFVLGAIIVSPAMAQSTYMPNAMGGYDGTVNGQPYHSQRNAFGGQDGYMGNQGFHTQPAPGGGVTVMPQNPYGGFGSQSGGGYSNRGSFGTSGGSFGN